MYARRKKDRRGFGGRTSFPILTEGGSLVEEERRSIPDRRLGNIHLELADPIGHGFPECIADRPFYLSGKKNC
jgi:hypothetical protein